MPQDKRRGRIGECRLHLGVLLVALAWSGCGSRSGLQEPGHGIPDASIYPDGATGGKASWPDAGGPGGAGDSGAGDSGAASALTPGRPGAHVPVMGPVRLVAAGLHGSCAQLDNGSLRCWGQVPGTAPAGPFTKLALGEHHGCGLHSGGELECWGPGDPPAAAPPERFDDLCVRPDSTCGLRRDGQIRCWGKRPFSTQRLARSYRALGCSWAGILCGLTAGGRAECWRTPRGGPPAGALPPLSRIALGASSLCGLDLQRRIRCWAWKPYLDAYLGGVAMAIGGEALEIVAGGDHKCVLRPHGGIACWGNHDHNQLAVPRGEFRQLSAGADHTCAVSTSGFVACWGADRHGQSSPPPELSGPFTTRP